MKAGGTKSAQQINDAQIASVRTPPMTSTLDRTQMERPQIVWRKDENGKTIKTAQANIQM